MPEPKPQRLPIDPDDHRVEAEGARRSPRPMMEDPLEELARILGETTAYPARPETAAEAGRRGGGPARPMPQQLSALEAELFDELRASVTPEVQVRGSFEREITPPIPQHPADDRDIGSLRGAAPQAEPEPPRSVEGTEAQWSDFYAYDDGVAAGSYDPAFAHEDPRYAPYDPTLAVDPEGVRAAHDPRRAAPAYPQATFDEFGRDEIAEAARESAPTVAAEPRVRPHSRAEQRAAAQVAHDSSGGGMKIAIAALALMVVGGGALAAWKFIGGTRSDAPVLIQADGKPLKTVPEPTRTSAADTRPSLNTDAGKGASRIVSMQEDPVDQVSGRTAEGKEVRLINPGAQRPSNDTPHTVKTVVVRPDGTIVSDGAAPAPAKPTTTPTATPPTASPPRATMPVATPPQAADPPPEPTETPPVAHPIEGTPMPMPKPARDAPAAPQVKTVAVTPITVPKPTAAAPKPTAPPAGAPLSLGSVGPKLAGTPPAAAPAPTPARTTAAPSAITPPPSGGSGDYLVQISASGSDAAARSSFAAAQRRYSALAGKSVDVQRADLGAKGVFYRARVPAGTRDQATALCRQLQSQGGQCMVVRR